MPVDKRLPYEFDIRVPFWMSGPNITANQSIDTPILSLDIAPTLLDLAGLPADPNMDGLSFLSLIKNISVAPTLVPPVEEHVNQSEGLHQLISNTITRLAKWPGGVVTRMASVDNVAKVSDPVPGISPNYTGIEGRHSFLVEYSGEGTEGSSSPECKEKLQNDLGSLSECDARLDCKCQDARNNTYACIRTHGQENSLFCKFEDKGGFLEMYTLSQDKFQLLNVAGLLQEETKKHYLGELDILRNCKGEECNNV